MKNGDLEVTNLTAFPALQLLCHRLQAENPQCSLTVYETHEGEYRLHLIADEQSPFFRLDLLFQSVLWGSTLSISELSIAMDERKQCYILLQKAEPLPTAEFRPKKRAVRL